MGHPARGARVCWYHSGAKRDVRAAGQRRLALAEARKMMETYGRPITIDPAEALLNEVQWTAGHVAWLRERVQGLEDDQLVSGIVEQRTSGRAGDAEADSVPARVETLVRSAPNVWLTLYQSERRHLVEVSALALRAGIEERCVKLAEAQGVLVADLIKRLLDDPQLGLTAEQRQMGRRIASNHLRALEPA